MPDPRPETSPAVAPDAPEDPLVLHAIADLLRDRHWKLAVAESLTAGHVQALLASISGSSDYFVGGITAYDLAWKVELLGVDAKQAFAVNGVSAEIAEQMARGVIRLFRADCGVATTGYAESNAAWQVAAPFAFCCVAVPATTGGIRCHTERFEVTGSRVEVQRIIAASAVDLVHRALVAAE